MSDRIMNKVKINQVTNLIEADEVKYYSFAPLEKFEWLVQGFSAKTGGVSKGYCESLNLGFERGDEESNVWENIKLLGLAAGFKAEEVAFPNQWHTNNIRVVDNEYITGTRPDKQGEQVDGQITDCSDKVLFAYGADCTPVYLIDEATHSVGLCHSGWRGTAASIVEAAIFLMGKNYGSKPENITAVIGPSISMKAYEVSSDVAEIFITKHNINVSETSDIVCLGKEEGKYQLDLWAANKANLLSAGVMENKIFISGICTYTEKDLLFSHRREGNKRGVMAAFLAKRE